MEHQQVQSELSAQLRSWAASETYEDGRQRLQRLAAEYEKLAVATAERAAKWNGLVVQTPRQKPEKTE